MVLSPVSVQVRGKGTRDGLDLIVLDILPSFELASYKPITKLGTISSRICYTLPLSIDTNTYT